jgi:autotransporter-associated beta strand protein
LLFSQAAGSSLNIAATISGSGEVEQTGAGTLVLDGVDSFTGGLIIAGGTLELSAGNAAGSGPIEFAGDPTLRLDGTIMPTGTISGLAVGDAIDLTGVTYASGGSATIINSNTLQVIENSATYDLTLDPLQNFRHFSFTPTPDAGTGTLITVGPACYCSGTRILTIRGEIAVEDLRIGDHLVTLSGEPRPVRWIGRRHLDLTRHPTPDHVQPIRIRANAFADNAPHRDLLVSPDHAVLCEGVPGGGVLVPARLLLNGASIVRDTHHRAVTYYHVELETHDLLLAEGLPAESYLDTGNRAAFANASASETAVAA